jgi:hypothetical protein
MLTGARERLGEPGDRSHGAPRAMVALSVGLPVGEGVTGGDIDLDGPAVGLADGHAPPQGDVVEACEGCQDVGLVLPKDGQPTIHRRLIAGRLDRAGRGQGQTNPVRRRPAEIDNGGFQLCENCRGPTVPRPAPAVEYYEKVGLRVPRVNLYRCYSYRIRLWR